MKRIQLSAAGWYTPAAAHAALAAALCFPPYYGHNLDALSECLRDDVTDTQLVIENCAAAAAHMPEKWPVFLAVFLDAASENPGLEIRLLPGDGDYEGEEYNKNPQKRTEQP